MRSEPWSPLPTSSSEDFGASSICWKGPSTILLPLQEALNNYMNLPKYGKKAFTNQGHLAHFPAAHFSLGMAHCPVGFPLLLGVFPWIVGHIDSLVLFNFLKARSVCWLRTYYMGKKWPQRYGLCWSVPWGGVHINSNFSYMKPSKRRSFMRLLSKKAEGMERGRKERAGKD